MKKYNPFDEHFDGNLSTSNLLKQLEIHGVNSRTTRSDKIIYPLTAVGFMCLVIIILTNAEHVGLAGGVFIWLVGGFLIYNIMAFIGGVLHLFKYFRVRRSFW